MKVSGAWLMCVLAATVLAMARCEEAAAGEEQQQQVRIQQIVRTRRRPEPSNLALRCRA